MVAFVKYHSFIDEISKGGHNLQTAVFKCALTNTAPTAASDTVWNTTVAPAPAAAAGYTAGGNTLTTSSATTTSGAEAFLTSSAPYYPVSLASLMNRTYHHSWR